MRSLLLLMSMFTLLALAGCTAAPSPLPDPLAARPTATLHPLFEQREGGRIEPASRGGNTFEPAPVRAESEIVGAGAPAAGAQPGASAGDATPASAGAAVSPPPSTPDQANTAAPSTDSTGTPVSSAGSPAGSDSSTIAPGAGGAVAALQPPEPNVSYIFSDIVHPDWTLQNSNGIAYRVVEPSRAYSGTTALALTPMADYGMLFFTVRDGAGEAYLRRQVERVVFWIYSPDLPLNLDSLAVTIVGSNVYPYWVKGDNSVENDSWPIFSETRLEFLGFNHPIPPDTWAEVEIWLDDLLYDPTYEWITGFYIKNDEGFYETFLIDEVHLVMVEE
jgi:hypothetical protein